MRTCCPHCGAEIGLLGRLFQWLRLGLHRCGPPQKPWTIDRDGRVKTDKHRPVVLRGRG